MPFTKKPDNQLVLILDVESSIIHGTLVVISPVKKPNIIYTYTASIACGPSADTETLIKATIAGIEETIKAAELYMNGNSKILKIAFIPLEISSLHYALSSPWIVSESKVMVVKFDKETTITEKYVTEMVNKDRAKIVEPSADPVEVVEQKIFDVKLNGYSVCNWQNKKSDLLEVSFSVSIAGSKMADLFRKEGKRLVSANDIHFHSSLLLQYIGIETLINPSSDYIIVHVHSDDTDISIVRRKNCVFSGSFPFGARTAVDMIAKATNNRNQAIDSLIALYVDGNLDDTHNKRIIGLVETVFQEWLNDLDNTVATSKVEIAHPASIILNASDHEGGFLKVLKSRDQSDNASELLVEELASGADFSGSAEKNSLSILHATAIHSIFLSKLC